FEETLNLAESVEGADDIQDRVRSQIPQLHWRHAVELYRASNLDGAIEAFQETITAAEHYGDENTKARAAGNLPRLYLSKGNSLYRNGDHAAALEAYNGALELNPNYPRAIYQKGLVYRQQDNLEGALEQFDLAINMSLNANDMEMVERASGAAEDYLVYLGANSTQDENYSRALELLERAISYDESSAEAYYRLAEAHNHLGNWNEAIANGTQALEYEDGGRADQAKIWFEMGMAYKNQENEPQACESFQNAAFGSFQSPAEHELEHELNCAQASR
ncbi:MAG: tetratricopeptide repeat protein, partial [Balneolales bacterium]